MRFQDLLAFGLHLASSFASVLRRGQHAAITERQSAPYPANIFNQPIDHFPESSRYAPHVKETFKQRYYFDSTYYKSGGPVFLYIGGETSGPSRFSNLENGIIQILMQATNGLGVILENRFYGDSYPFENSTTDNLRFMTTEQTIADNAYFAQHATFPGIVEDLTAPHTPWVLYGGSLAGAQTAFSIVTYGDILYGGIASSGVVYGQLAYPEWYDPIQKFAPQDCVSSINGIIEKIDYLVDTRNTKAIQELKSIFGLESLEDIRDFAQTIAFPMGGPLNYPIDTWQELNWYPAYSGPEFFYFCGNVTNINSPPNITAVDNQLAKYTHGATWTNLGNYANYFKEVYLPLCPNGDYNNVECFGTQNQTYYADVANGDGRSYLYTTCTENGAYQVAPASGPSLIMNVLQVDYTQQWCDWSFPPGKYNRIPPSPDLARWNKYGGLNIKADRLAIIDGDADPWLGMTYHSTAAPLRVSTAQNPEYLITGSGHHWDSYGILDIPAEPLFIQQAHLWEIRIVQGWLKEFSNWKPGKTS